MSVESQAKKETPNDGFKNCKDDPAKLVDFYTSLASKSTDKQFTDADKNKLKEEVFDQLQHLCEKTTKVARMDETEFQKLTKLFTEKQTIGTDINTKMSTLQKYLISDTFKQEQTFMRTYDQITSICRAYGDSSGIASIDYGYGGDTGFSEAEKNTFASAIKGKEGNTTKNINDYKLIVNISQKQDKATGAYTMVVEKYAVPKNPTNNGDQRAWQDKDAIHLTTAKQEYRSNKDISFMRDIITRNERSRGYDHKTEEITRTKNERAIIAGFFGGDKEKTEQGISGKGEIDAFCKQITERLGSGETLLKEAERKKAEKFAEAKRKQEVSDVEEAESLLT